MKVIGVGKHGIQPIYLWQLVYKCYYHNNLLAESFMYTMGQTRDRQSKTIGHLTSPHMYSILLSLNNLSIARLLQVYTGMEIMVEWRYVY